ncbi:3-(cis-5,6-dihydroxycyclohexa-1,3-dien-1-yl)propanoate dehydrogenase [Sinorhizobium saheli]|uniref:Cis-2,3-dihydrobiphenyl-2,3-diol dehydrogenase n=1 Tax=Sinorhizobium saheli TaxID=36856 RepID=A0A178YKN5_SINSA|nr:3-(cis-5,6-dihydroxycyclohexa-1,3-dien-1-yl)propanoate dehydrogenase [Sinorhizobium saheli]MQW86945.1 3-(cis-5,6-dihydroxycyclohexa-1,3-dien-1-yl)propanoate dehydrogenase [Sinorhizobium saheli]OAP47967.1 cis-2,3-dihydrobiphenyl-2,3-diol dehydrogenase [Sinorhizobium saheli]
MTGRLQGHVAIVTGGGKGIGRAVVDRFVAEGARVGVLVRSETDVRSLTTQHGDHVLPIIGDVRNWADNLAAVEATTERWGRLDTLIPNAGVYDFSDRFESIPGETLAERWREIFEVNVQGYLLAARAGLEPLRASRGSIVFTLSSSSFYAGGGGTLYVSSKHALVGTVRQLAYELAPEIRVNAVAPGGTRTGLRGADGDGRSLAEIEGFDAMVARNVPLGFLSEPRDHAGLYVTLALRSESGFVTSEIIRSDGGIEVRGGRRKNREQA